MQTQKRPERNKLFRYGTKVCRYNIYIYIFQVKYVASLFIKQHSETVMVWNTSMLIAFFKNNFIVLFIIIFRTLSLPIVCFIELLLLKHRFCHFWQCPHSMRSRVCASVRWINRWTVLSGNWPTVRGKLSVAYFKSGATSMCIRQFRPFFSCEVIFEQFAVMTTESV